MPPPSRDKHSVTRVLHELEHFDGIAVFAPDPWQHIHEIVDLPGDDKVGFAQ